MRNEIELPGCTPEPLMSYLKALGIFRLVAEQADKDARLSWRGGIAVLHTKLDRDELSKFFLHDYKPTPVMTPWNSASGFAPTKSGNKAPKDKAARNAVEKITQNTMIRFESYRNSVRRIRSLSRGNEDSENWKDDFFARCRAELPDAVIAWLDTCFALTNDSLSAFCLLGSGGNDGVTDFGSLFMQRLCDVLLDPPKDCVPPALLESALFSGIGVDGEVGVMPSLLRDTVGQFNPHGIGGPNAVQGDFEAASKINPWDFVLMIEGVMLLAGSVSRRMGSNTDDAIFPFTVESVVVGNGSFCEKESRNQGKEPPNSGELWLPLWNQDVSISEIKHLFSEGRAQIGRRQARNSVEMAISICTLGIDRGIATFARYGFLRRNGKAFLATPLGRFAVTSRPLARLLTDNALTSWLDKFRRLRRENDGKKEKVPSRYKAALRNIDRAMFAFTNRSETGNDSRYLLEILRAIGQAERTLALQGLGWLNDKQYGWKLRPLTGLNEQWLSQSDDRSAEFRLAASLAGIRPTKNNEVGPVRAFLEEVEVTKFVNWNPGSTSAVWSKQPLANNLASVFRRRQMEAFRSGIVGVPIDSACLARLDDVITFLNEDTDDEKLSDLLWGMICIEYPTRCAPFDASTQDIPFEFGIPRLLVNTRCLAPNDGYWHLSDSEANAKPDPDVFHHLASGQSNAVSESMTRAARRLRSGGLLVAGYRNRRHSGNPINVVSPFDPTRLLASMLFPLSDRDLERIANAVLYPVESEASHVD